VQWASLSWFSQNADIICENQNTMSSYVAKHESICVLSRILMNADKLFVQQKRKKPTYLMQLQIVRQTFCSFWLCSRNSRPFWSLITIGRHAAVNIATAEIKILNRASQTIHHQRPNTNMRIVELWIYPDLWESFKLQYTER
jgi:hypothetical protein